tara:strand:- start:1347 stop:2354 length:1008 start_codon:yes stop_codon:yes gene_type:complete
MAQHDMNIANQSFPDFRTDLNNSLSAINSMHSGTSRPSGAVAGTLWLDTTNSGSNSLEIKFFDGSDDISFATVNTSANTINFIDSAVASDLVNDSSPQLGADLDTNSFNIKIDDAHFIADDDGNEQIIFQKTGSAVNELEVTNASTGNPPILGASGETNVDLHIKPKGSGEVVIGTGSASATLTTSGTHDLVLDTNSGTNSGNITITDGANGDINISTNGTGAIKFNDLALIPQQALTSSSNATAWDTQAKPNAYHLTTENTTFSAPTNPVEGAFICLEINYDGSHTIAFNTVFEFAGSTAPTFTSTDGKTDILVFKYNGSIWQEVGRTLNLSES